MGRTREACCVLLNFCLFLLCTCTIQKDLLLACCRLLNPAESCCTLSSRRRSVDECIYIYTYYFQLALRRRRRASAIFHPRARTERSPTMVVAAWRTMVVAAWRRSLEKRSPRFASAKRRARERQVELDTPSSRVNRVCVIIIGYAHAHA